MESLEGTQLSPPQGEASEPAPPGIKLKSQHPDRTYHTTEAEYVLPNE